MTFFPGCWMSFFDGWRFLTSFSRFLLALCWFSRSCLYQISFTVFFFPSEFWDMRYSGLKTISGWWCIFVLIFSISIGITTKATFCSRWLDVGWCTSSGRRQRVGVRDWHFLRHGQAKRCNFFWPSSISSYAKFLNFFFVREFFDPPGRRFFFCIHLFRYIFFVESVFLSTSNCLFTFVFRFS